MPCCAFAAFIFGQVLISLDAAKRFFWGGAASIAPDNPATEWRLNGFTTPSKSPRRLGFRWVAVVALVEIALVAGGAYGLRAHLGHHLHDSYSPQIEYCPR